MCGAVLFVITMKIITIRELSHLLQMQFRLPEVIHKYIFQYGILMEIHNHNNHIQWMRFIVGGGGGGVSLLWYLHVTR